jgi:hypothetical protein
MNSKERILAALRCEPVDRVPCDPWFFENYVAKRGRRLSAREMLCYLVKELGADAHLDCMDADPGSGDHVGTGLAWGHTPGVEAEFSANPDVPLLHKVFHTPDGDLSATIRSHPSLPRTDDIPLVCDYNAPVFVKPWIDDLADVERFRHVCRPPSAASVAAFQESFRQTKALAEEFGVPIVAHVGMGLTLLIQLMGGERAAIASIECPELVERFLDIEHETNLAMIEIYGRAGVDIICRNGFYETCDFWSPRQVRQFVLPRVNEEARLAHSLGALMVYTACTGILPLLDLYLASEIDGIQKFETRLTGQTLEPIAGKLAGRKCLWGGLSDCVDLGQATPDETRKAVQTAFDLIGRRGLILAASPSIKAQRPVENVEAMFEAWRMYG